METNLSALREWLTTIEKHPRLSTDQQETGKLMHSSIQYLLGKRKEEDYWEEWKDFCKNLSNSNQRYSIGSILSSMAAAVLYFKQALDEQEDIAPFLFLLEDSFTEMYKWCYGEDWCEDDDKPFSFSESLFVEIRLRRCGKRTSIKRMWRLAEKQYVALEEAKSLNSICYLRKILFQKSHWMEANPWSLHLCMLNVGILLISLLMTFYPACYYSIKKIMLLKPNEFSWNVFGEAYWSEGARFVNFAEPSIGLIICLFSALLAIVFIFIGDNLRMNRWFIYRHGTQK